MWQHQRDNPGDAHSQILQAMTENEKDAFLKEFCTEKMWEYVYGVASIKITPPSSYRSGGSCITNWIGGTLFTNCD